MQVLHLIEPLTETITDQDRENFIRVMGRALCGPEVSVEIYEKIPGETAKQKAVWMYDVITNDL